MGEPLSPFLANLFLSYMETTLAEKTWFPRIWKRYVDDIFCVIKKQDVNIVLHELNNQYDSVKFTVEEEVNESLPLTLSLTFIVNQPTQHHIFQLTRTTTCLINMQRSSQ